MTPPRPTRLAPLLVVAGCLVGLLALYVGGYFLLCTRPASNSKYIFRDFKHECLCAIYRPVPAAGNLMLRPERQPTSRQDLVDLGDSKWKRGANARRPASRSAAIAGLAAG